MTTAFVMKAVVSFFILGLGALLLWANNAHEKDLNAAKKMHGSGWEGNLDEMRGGGDDGETK